MFVFDIRRISFLGVKRSQQTVEKTKQTEEPVQPLKPRIDSRGSVNGNSRKGVWYFRVDLVGYRCEEPGIPSRVSG